MESNNKYFVIPAEMIDNPMNHKYALPIFTFLQCRRGNDYRCLINLKTLITICGYDTTSRSNSKKHIPTIKECLMQLRDDGYIYQFYNGTGFSVLSDDEFASLQAADVFCIEMNPMLSDDTSFGFVSMSVFDYGTLYEHLQVEDAGVVYWKILTVYIFILRRMWKRKGYYKEDRTQLKAATVQENPEFCFMKQNSISEVLGSGFSVGTITKIKKYLNEICILHSTDFYYKGKSDGSDVRPNKGGTIFVRHSNVWGAELSAARQKVEKNYKNYIQKEVK